MYLNGIVLVLFRRKSEKLNLRKSERLKVKEGNNSVKNKTKSFATLNTSVKFKVNYSRSHC